ncbi:MAG: heat shock protein HtpX [Abditibacteriota bacterium]|nr:heat shock protein HtpX [Abditibacteriota bacterium]
MFNTLKVGLLLTALTMLFVLVGRAIGGPSGAIIAFGMALLMNAGSYWFSDKIVLKMYGAQPLTPQQAPALYEMTQRIAERAKLPMPALYIIEDPQPNAFATGRSPSHAAVAVNRGLLNMLSRDEVEGVIAHEIGHIKHRDTLTMTIVATVAGAVMMLAQIGQFAAMFGGMSRDDDDEGMNPLGLLFAIIVAPIAATIIQMAVSRAREFEADATAARLTGSPHGLINALSKLEMAAHQIPSNANPQTAHMFIVNPLAGKGAALLNLFMTHPPMEKRIARLQQLNLNA